MKRSVYVAATGFFYEAPASAAQMLVWKVGALLYEEGHIVLTIFKNITSQ